MARKPEQKLWDRMRKATDKAKIRLERIENAVSDGIPDVLAIARGGVVTFVELKQIEAFPMRATTRLLPSGKGLRLSQRNWHLEWNRHEGRSLIVVGVGLQTIYCVPGVFADEINSMTEARMRTFSVANGWQEVERYLRGYK